MEVQRESVSKSPRSWVLFFERWLREALGRMEGRFFGAVKGVRSRYNRLLAGSRPSTLDEGYATSQ